MNSCKYPKVTDSVYLECESCHPPTGLCLLTKDIAQNVALTGQRGNECILVVYCYWTLGWIRTVEKLSKCISCIDNYS